MENFEKECVICGCHVYKEIWEATIGEELDCQWELKQHCRSICCGGLEEQHSCWPFTEETITYLLTIHRMLARATSALSIADEDSNNDSNLAGSEDPHCMGPQCGVT